MMAGVALTTLACTAWALRRARQQRDHARLELDQLQQAIPHLFWEVGDCDEVGRFNRRWHDYTGIVPGAQSSWEALLHPEDVEVAQTLWQESRQLQQAYSTEYRLRRHDGVFRWHLVRGLPIRGAGGKICKWVGTCTDIHDQKLISRALRNSKSYLQAVVTHAPIVLTALDREGIYKLVEGRDLAALGLQPHELLGQAAATVHHQQPEVAALIHRALSGRAGDDELLLSGHWFHIFCTPMVDAHGDVEGAVCLFINVTSRKLSEKAYQDSQRLFDIIEAHHRIATGSLEETSPETLVMQEVKRLCGAKITVLISREGDALVIQQALGAADLVGQRLSPADKSLSKLVIAQGRPLLSNAYANDARVDPARANQPFVEREPRRFG